MIDVIFVVVFVSGITTLSLIGITIKLFGQGILDKLNSDWKKKHDIEISELMNKLQKDEKFFHTLLQIYKSSNDEIQKERVNACISIWDLCHEIKCVASPLLTIYAVLLDSEIETLYEKPEIFQYLEKELPKITDFLESLKKTTQNERKIRIFISDDIWRIYSIYRGFIIRLFFNFYNSTKNKKIPNWKTSKSTKEYLSLVIDQTDLGKIYKLKINSTGFILTYLEEILLIEINKTFSGEFTIRNQQELFERINNEFIEKPLKLEEILDKPELQFLLWQCGH